MATLLQAAPAARWALCCCKLSLPTYVASPVPGDLIVATSVLQLDMRGLDGVFSFKGSVAGSVNNALHIAKEQTGATAPLPAAQCTFHSVTCVRPRW
jgi:hypothetical protein